MALKGIRIPRDNSLPPRARRALELLVNTDLWYGDGLYSDPEKRLSVRLGSGLAFDGSGAIEVTMLGSSDDLAFAARH